MINEIADTITKQAPMQIGTRWNFSFLRFRLLSEIFELSISKFSLLILIPLNFNWSTQFECRWLFLILRNSCRLNRSTMLLEVLSRINSCAFFLNFSKKDVYRINFIIKGEIWLWILDLSTKFQGVFLGRWYFELCFNRCSTGSDLYFCSTSIFQV